VREPLSSEIRKHPGKGVDAETLIWAEEIDRLEIPWHALFRFDGGAIRFEYPLFSGWPPYCFPAEIPLEPRSLKACLAHLLENYEYLVGLPADCPWAGEFRAALRLKIKCGPPAVPPATDDTFRHPYNRAIHAHFFGDGDSRAALDHYQGAFDLAADDDQRALVSTYCALLHCDSGRPGEALALCRSVLSMAPGETCAAYLKSAAVQAFTQSAADEGWENDAPYFFTLTREALAFFKDHHDQMRYAELLQDSAAIARKKGNFSEALSTLSLAHDAFAALELADNVARVHLAKAEILTQWGGQNPAFYDQALKHFDLALGIFTREAAPLLYADIQLQVAILYAEKPGGRAQQLIWRSHSIQAFKNALVASESAPVQRARVAHNYASAIAKFGLELDRNENDRALALIRSALEIRNAADDPLERAFSLLTLTEILWSSLEFGEGDRADQLEEIRQVITEIESLTDRPEILTELEQHKQLLEKTDKTGKETLYHA
jgi:tetratricopeptide (TPR) repeat protein